MRAGLLLRALLVLAILLGITSGARVAGAQLLSPGPLSRSHASLEGDQHCSDCHSSGKRVDQGACIKCHGDIGARISAGQGLHGTQFRGQACEGCHVEHVGGGPPTRWPSGGPSSLDHAQTGWPLNGAHKTTPCSKCHNRANARGAPTFLGAPKACASCHKDPHDGRFGATCATCHNEAAWKEVSQQGLQSFNHDNTHFPLRGAHTTVGCAKCHSEPPKYTGLKFALCGDCHKDPHAGRLGAACTDCHEDTRWKPVTFRHAAAKHPGVSLANGHAAVQCQACHDRGNLAAPSKGTQCASCHRSVHKAPFGSACGACHGSIQWLGLPRSVGLASHAKTIYPLTGKHEDASCAGCHKPALREKRYRGLASDRCADCHEDKHTGEFAKQDGGECKTCHTTGGFRPTVFGVEAHASTHFPLTGKHTASPCSACHSNTKPLLDLHVSKQACADCHQNPHGTQFATEMASGGCAHCHEAAGWNLPKIDHSTWPLTGAHATTSCNGCHHPTAEDRKAGHGASYRGVPRNCSGCHDDAHLGQFRLSQPALECDRCHATGSFKIPRFDHEKVAGWALTGAHAKQECAKCHAPATVAGGRTTVRWRGPSTECSFCHANPHDRRPSTTAAVARPALLTMQVAAPVAPPAPTPVAASAPPAPPPAPAPAPASSAASTSPSPHGKSFTDAVPCSACHSTTAWKSRDAAGVAVKFDHSTTGFPLTGKHQQASCVSCHNSSAPLKRACASCHDDYHRGRLSQGCDTCHMPAGWKVTRPLEIHRFTRFPLTGMHTLADCTQCHLRASEQRFTDAPVDCYGCHQQDYQRPGIFPHTGSATMAPLPRDCSLCHRAVAWVPANVPASLTASTSSGLHTQQQAPPGHDLRFPISFGSHRLAACSDCHSSTSTPRAVRCVGCHAHDPVLLTQQHSRPVATDGPSCLTCHVAGVRR